LSEQFRLVEVQVEAGDLAFLKFVDAGEKRVDRPAGRGDLAVDPGAYRPSGPDGEGQARDQARSAAANLRSERGTYQDDKAEQRLIGLGRNCQPKQADTPRSPVLVPGCPPFRDQRLWPAR
jgi:hypothetical protein